MRNKYKQANNQELDRCVPRGALIAVCLSFFTLPVVGAVVSESLKLSRDARFEDTQMMSYEVDRVFDLPYGQSTGWHRRFDIDDGINRLGPKPVDKKINLKQLMAGFTLPKVSFALPALHSPFKPPTPSAESQQNGSGTAIASAGDQSQVEDSMSWHPPRVSFPALTKEQLSEIKQQMHIAEELIANRRVKDAIVVYTQLLARYPQYQPLRLKTINACVSIDNRKAARDLCVDGMKCAGTYIDYLVLRNLFRTLMLQQ